MIFDLDVKNFTLEQCKTKNNLSIVSDYYTKKKLDHRTTTDDWFLGLANNEYPSFTETLRLVKKYKKKDNNVNLSKKK